MAVLSNLLEVFYCYSHKDESLRDELEKHLTILRHQRIVSNWHDRRIGPGNEWKGRIDEHLNRAQVVLLLISSDFLASPYCYDVEMKRALERHDAGLARVIPVILRACLWDGSPFSKLQALPKDALPITSWSNIDEAFFDVAKGVREAITLLVGEADTTVNHQVSIPPHIFIGTATVNRLAAAGGTTIVALIDGKYRSAT